MPNKSGNAYGLTTLCPIKIGHTKNQSFPSLTREIIESLPVEENSPMAKIPNTYFARLLILNDPIYEGAPHGLDQLKSKYLIFTSNFYGNLDDYLKGMWSNAEEEIRHIWQHCLAFDKVVDSGTFVEYIKKCQVKTTYYFVGSNDDSLEEQLKALYLKQEFSKFVYHHQGVNQAKVFEDFKKFIETTKPEIIEGPTWKAGCQDLKNIVVNNN